MFSHNAIIFIALFVIVSPTRSIHDSSARKSQKIITQNGPQAARKEYHRSTRQGSVTQPNRAPEIKQQPGDYSYQYQPFSSAPDHIKQLIHQAYEPQGPYVNPHAFFYNINSPIQYQDLSSEHFAIPKSTKANASPSQSPIAYRTTHKPAPPAQTIARVSKIPKQSGIRYKSDINSPRYNSENRANYFLQQEQMKRSPEINSPTRKYSNNDQEYRMPSAIEQLLQYQAQIPYNVLANYIFFQQQKPFVPKPLPENVIKHSGFYPNQVYYLKTDGEIYTDGDDKITDGE